MTTTAIRSKLFDYIRLADDKKLKAIFTILENEISETKNWWEDKALLNDFDKRFNDWESGKDKGFSMNQIKQEIITKK
ncbi:MAG: hypothetical protein RL065_1023 [Bacteroidota bacterium]|jgi:hypothetical protein